MIFKYFIIGISEIMSFTITVDGFGILNKPSRKITLVIPSNHFIWIAVHSKKIIGFWIISPEEMEYLNPQFQTNKIEEIKILSEIYNTKKQWLKFLTHKDNIENYFIGYRNPTFTREIFPMIKEYYPITENKEVKIKYQVGKDLKIISHKT